ncbi:MAG: acyl-CoA thioesterase [Alphaproteobacteria bacterium]|nr:acyl-CoA thioesterase [Alphaproteobacteria bacterium]
MADSTTHPTGTLELKTLCMPESANPSGDIFGGWLLGQMDIAGANTAYLIARGRVVTVALDAMEFHKPVFVGDVLSCFTSVLKVGRTSIRILVQAFTTCRDTDTFVKVTEGTFTYVAVDDDRKPRPIPKP